MPSKSDQSSKTKAKDAAIAARSAALPKIPKNVDQLVTGWMSAAELNTVTMALKKALVERALGAELSHHLGYRPGAERPDGASNHRNGASAKTVLTDDGPLRIEVPRDRSGTFEPLLVPKHERRFTGFDDKIIAMYARGMTMREIQASWPSSTAPGQSRVHQRGHRRGDGRSHGLAGTSARADVPGGLLRCAAREDSRGRGGAQQSDLTGARCLALRHA
jgi:Transposase, Mutator family